MFNMSNSFFAWLCDCGFLWCLHRIQLCIKRCIILHVKFESRMLYNEREAQSNFLYGLCIHQNREQIMWLTSSIPDGSLY